MTGLADRARHDEDLLGVRALLRLVLPRSRRSTDHCAPSQRLCESVDVPGVIVPNAVDKERGGTVDTARDPAEKVVVNAGCVNVGAEIGHEPLLIESQLACISKQGSIRQCALILEDRIVHLPKESLRCRGLGGFGRVLCVRVKAPKWKVSKDKPELPS